MSFGGHAGISLPAPLRSRLRADLYGDSRSRVVRYLQLSGNAVGAGQEVLLTFGLSGRL